jgi:signal transduction histidine kinase/HD-like signal output (HDOD) protein
MTSVTPSAPRVDPAAILSRIDALPTPSPLAIRLLATAEDERSSAHDLVDLIRQDAALTAKVLSICRRGPRGRALDVASLDRAVVLLGFGAIRAAALAVEFVGALHGTNAASALGFDRHAFWRHSLGKAIVAEHAARLSPRVPSPGRAFVAGLLQDLGALALAAAAPAICDRCCDEAERGRTTLDERVADLCGIGLHAIGARLAERWNLPEELVATQRIRGDLALAYDGEHRGLVLAVELADRVVRRRHVGGAGFALPAPSADTVRAALEIDPEKFRVAAETLFDDLCARAESLGMNAPPPTRLANECLERASRRTEPAPGAEVPSGDVVAALDAAHDPASTLSIIVRQLASLGGAPDRYLVQLSEVAGRRAELREVGADGVVHAVRAIGDGDPDGELAVRRWCELRAPKGRPTRLALSLRGRCLAVIHRADGEIVRESSRTRTPVDLWAFALAASIDRECARRTSADLDEAHRRLSREHARLERLRVRSAVAEIANGLAHELNNPLAVASLRAQMARKCAPLAIVPALDQIVDSTKAASDLVTELLRTLRPAEAEIASVGAHEVVRLAIDLVGRAAEPVRTTVRGVVLQSDPIACAVDPAQITEALAEVVQNARDASGTAPIEVFVERDAARGRCIITVKDSGPGFSANALAHATEPFFSERSAGRGPGLGLARARALVGASGGTLEIRNGETGGAEVAVVFWTDVARAKEALRHPLGVQEAEGRMRDAA